MREKEDGELEMMRAHEEAMRDVLYISGLVERRSV